MGPGCSLRIVCALSRWRGAVRVRGSRSLFEIARDAHLNSLTRSSTRSSFNLAHYHHVADSDGLNSTDKEIAEKALSPADSSGEYEEGAPESSKTRGIKRARTSKTASKDKQQGKRRKTAKLSMLPDMPVDILYEVRGSTLWHIS